MTPLVSIIIPSYNHAEFLADAVKCALAQTVPCEVIVVDDGSTDDTATIVERSSWPITVIRTQHRGPCHARNSGLDAAHGEYVMFLDADDLIASTKVEEQLAHFSQDVGWVLSDVLIEDAARGRSVLASTQYRYDDKDIGGWIQPLLKDGNFIPIMAPLVRRDVLEGIRFEDGKVPEDWHFWYAVAGRARVRYVPRVLATYRHRRNGRSRLPKKARQYSPNVTVPLRLNLGCGTPTTRSWHPITGMVNLDKSIGWRFEDGLGDFIDQSVSGITISHALMYLDESEWPSFFAECARVLEEDGVLRITEDDAVNPTSKRFGGWKGSDAAITLTSPAKLREYLERAGFVAVEVDRDKTHYRDGSLCQAQHGPEPDVFFIEGLKVPRVFFAPHSDDETLFGAFTILRYRPRVVICFGSYGDYGDTAMREAETREAMSVLGASGVEQWAGGNGEALVAQMRAFDERVRPAHVWAPDRDSSHRDHIAVAVAARDVFGPRVTTYHTYRYGEKVRSDRPVPYEPAWVQQKLRALLRYQSQLRHPRAYQFFAKDLEEYYG